MIWSFIVGLSVGFVLGMVVKVVIIVEERNK